MLTIAMTRCVDGQGNPIQDSCGQCGAFHCCRQSYLIGTDPCPDNEGIWVQQVTVEAACDNCPPGQPLPPASVFTYYEQLLNDPQTINRWTQCDCFGPWQGCGPGTRGHLSMTGVQKYFCLADFGGFTPTNPFAGQPFGVIPQSQTAFPNCPCLGGVDTINFPWLLYATPPTWWNSHRATATRTAVIE